jgi:hypothetical protein
MTVYLVISLPNVPYVNRIYMVLANPTYVRVCVCMCVRLRACVRVHMIKSVKQVYYMLIDLNHFNERKGYSVLITFCTHIQYDGQCVPLSEGRTLLNRRLHESIKHYIMQVTLDVFH